MARLFVLVLLAWAAIVSSSRAERPNFVVVLCDDLGYGDLGCYGHPVIQTPNVDRFATQGLKLTSCYAAAPNCSPARTGLMTGRTPYRVGVYDWIPMLSPMHVPAEEVTVAALLQQAGYDTCHVGKWHLNGMFNLPGQPQPDDHGFNHWFATQNNALPNHGDPYNFVRNRIPVGPLDGYAAQLVTDEAVRWLNRRSESERPFFLFVCYHEPHEPIATDDRYAALYPGVSPSQAAHHGNVTQMDAAFGRLLRALDALKSTDETFVLFTSDNGPAITSWHPHGSAGPLREKKGHLYEGGIRVPGIIRWPGKVAAGSESDVPVSGVDVLPTLCELAGIAPPQGRHLDGTSIAGLWTDQPVEREQPLYWQFNRASSRPKVVIRDGDWKLLAGLDQPELPRGASITPEAISTLKTARPTGFELYNLAEDIDESDNRAESEPQRLARMREQMLAIYDDIQANAVLWPEWDWPRYEGGRIEWPDYPKP